MRLAILTFIIMVALLIVIYIIDERKHRKRISEIEENLKGRYKMTFEEAIEIIEEVDGEVGAIGYIINKLQETYAPKIKMTSEQKEQFMAFVDSPDDKFENFWFCLGSGDSLYKNKISEADLMRAWLNPELIEVEG